MYTNNTLKQTELKGDWGEKALSLSPTMFGLFLLFIDAKWVKDENIS
jgi:hypothetical protein